MKTRIAPLRSGTTTFPPRGVARRGLRQGSWITSALLAGLGLLQATSSAQTLSTWVGGAAGNWSDGSKWSTSPNAPKNGFPGGGDVYDAVFGITTTVSLTENITIEGLTGTSGLTLQGAFSLNLNQGFDLDSSSARSFAGGIAVNLLGGTSTYSGTGNLNLSGASSLNNHSVLEWNTDADLVFSGGAAVQFNNLAGATLRKTGGADKLSLGGGITFNNSGTIDIDSGQFELAAGTFNLSNGSTFTGTGLTRAVSGAFTLSGTLSANNNFEIAGATIGGTHELTGGTWNWTSGALGSAGTTTLASGSTLELTGTSAKTISGRTFSNQGTLLQSGTGNLNLSSAAILDNLSLVEIQTDADLVFAGGAAVTFNNPAGATFRKSGGTGVTSIGSGITFNNAGTIDIDSGTLELAGGTFNLNHGTTFTGAGITRAVSGGVTLSGTLTANNNFEIAGATLGGTHTLTGGTWDWTSGTLGSSGTTTLASGSTLELTGASAKTISGRTFSNLGTLLQAGSGNLNLSSAAILDNLSLFEIQTDADLVFAGGAAVTFNNPAGATFRKSGGAGVTSMGSGITFNNAGIVDIDSGTLELTAGTFNLNHGSTFSGTGFTRVLSGGVTLSGTLTANDNFEIAGATIGGTHTLTGGTWDWTSGTLGSSGTTTIAGGSTLDLSGSSAKSLSARTLDNQGTLLVSGGGNVLISSAAILGNANLFEIQTDADLVFGGGSGTTFNNAAGATFRKSGGTDATSIGSGITFNNSGIVDIDAGRLDLSGGTFNLNDGSSFTGAGPTRAITGTFVLSGTLTANENFEIAGGTITGTHTLAGGTWDWTLGGFGGSGVTTLANGAVLELAGSSLKSVTTRTIDNRGTVVHGGTGNLLWSSATAFQNHGLFDIRGDADSAFAGGAATSFQNAVDGTFRKSAGSDVSSWGVSMGFSNAGLVEAESGTLHFASGTYSHAGGTLRVENGATIQFVSSQTLAAGRVEGNGTFLLPTMTASGATIAPGLSAGSLAIDGNLTLGALATLSIEIGGTDAGVSYDVLNVDGAVVAGGFLDVTLIDNFAPTAGMSFTVVDGTSAITGSFANIASGERLTLGNGSSFLVSYGVGSAFPDRVILSEFAPVPEPHHWALLAGSGLMIFATFRRAARNRSQVPA